MGTVNISSAWSKENRPRNGLVQIEDKLVDDELLDASYWGLVRIEPNFYKVDGEDGSRTPTVRIAHIEVVTDEDDVEAVRSLLQRRFKDRTGIDDAPPADLFSVLPGDGAQDADGERQVPEADGDEIMAERRERKEAEAAEQAGRVAPPAFSGGGEPA
ncbi:hypothetical protein OOJ91_13885 [Micromonospora lupini]|uniref:hypothetical protein n=1 Tax=Micromonospora lupini TaxID=285679 RepID=UPI002258543B|nr:hypothetical protein [Micromonospora lupini]MCX5066938.1 hypothetical protein [Micromonospora lupini]